METFIKKKWDEGYYITDGCCTGDVYYTLMEKNVGITSQEYRWLKSFPGIEGKEKFLNGRWITSLYTHDIEICVVTSNIHNISRQIWHKSVKFPKQLIEKSWKDGFSITDMAWFQGYWIVIMSKTHELGHKESWKTRFNPNPKRLNKQLYKETKLVTALTFGDGKWAFAFAYHPAVFGQKIISGKSFPEEEINQMWNRGYDISKATFGKGKWFLTFINTTRASSMNEGIKHHKINLERFREEQQYHDLVKYFEKNMLGEEEESTTTMYLEALLETRKIDTLRGCVKFYHEKFNTNKWNYLLGGLDEKDAEWKKKLAEREQERRRKEKSNKYNKKL
jgi:hypothetical protein